MTGRKIPPEITVILLLLTFGAVSYAGYFAWEMQNDYESDCRRLTAIAQDPQKINYVRQWAASRLKDPNFVNAVREHGEFAPDSLTGRGFLDPGVERYIDLDWGYLGFTEQYSRIEFNSHTPRRDVDAKEILSLSLYEGRSSIIIELTGKADLGLDWPPESMKELKDVGTSVFVDCGVCRYPGC